MFGSLPVGSVMEPQQTSEPSVFQLVGRLVRDLRDLGRCQFALMRSEARAELRQAVLPLALGAGAGSTLAAGGLWLLIGVTLGFADLFEVPVWGAYALIGVVLLVTGGLLMAVVQHQVRAMTILPKTREAIREDADWLRSGAIRQGDGAG